MLLLGTTSLFIFEEKFKLEWLKLRILFICLLILLSVCLAINQAFLGISFILIYTHKTLLIMYVHHKMKFSITNIATPNDY